jgi:hypothetical protein
MSVPHGGFSAWAKQTMTFTASSSSELLNFMAVGTSVPPVALLADVSLQAAIPEPETWALMALGFAGLALYSYRRRASRRAAA